MSDPGRPDLDGLSAEEQEILAFLLEQEEKPEQASGSIPRLDDRVDPPLSFAQERLWVVEQLDPASSAYNVPVAVALRGPLSVAALDQGLTEIVRRHEPLRTTFTGVAGSSARQTICEPAPVGARLVDLSGLAPRDREASSRRLSRRESARSFDLGHDHLLRSALLRLSDEDHRVVATMHHVASDAWSLGVLSRELGALYGSYARGASSPLTELAVQYADYAVWHRGLLSGDALEAQGRYWEDRLLGAPEVLTFPTDRPRPSDPTNEGGLYTFELSGALTEGLERLSRASDVTLFMTLMTAFEVLLHRYTGERDVCVGTDVANRTHPDTEAMIGFFVNQLVIRNAVRGEEPVRELLGRVRETMLEAFAHADLPFEQLVRRVNPDRERGVTPLFQVKFVLNNTPMETIDLSGVQLEPLEAEVGGAKFDVLLNMVRTGAGLRGSLEYATELYDAETVERMAGHFTRLLEAMVADPGQRVGALAMLTEAERVASVERFNATEEPYAVRTVAERFEAVARARPDATAVHGAEGGVVTYGALNARANRLAHELIARGVGADTLVGVYVERSEALVEALVAIEKAGGAYVPLDPSYPADRLAYVLADGDPAVVLTTESLAADVAGWSPDRVLVLDGADAAGVASRPATDPAPRATAESLAYVIYTSGSTGRPKGTLITHGGLSNYLSWATAYYGLAEGGPSVLHSPLGFDLTVTSLWGPLLAGQSVRLLGPEVAIDDLGAELTKSPDQCVLKVTPSHLSVLAGQVSDEAARALSRVLIVGGDQLTGELTSGWQARAPGMRIVNEYGPTETVVGCCIHELEQGRTYGGAIPIGRPIANTQLYVLGGSGEVVPAGVGGELHIGGAGVARGYLKRAGLTAERFVPDGWSLEPGRRVYRTGDVVRQRPDGDLEYQGRADHQVKVRGYRIELGEIEVVLGQHAGVEQAAVVVRETEEGQKQLVGYVEADAGEVGISDLRGHLLERLPEYMVPTQWVVLDALPLTANGKVDRGALPDPEGARLEVETGYAGPRTEVERTLVALWEEFLELDEVGIHDNFFELGGDSILSLQIVARCIGEGLTLTSQQLFEQPTVAGLAALIEGEGEAGDGAETEGPEPIERTEHDGPVPLSFAQERLWFLDQLEPGRSVYNIPAAVRITGPLTVAALDDALAEIVRRHDVLRTTFPIVDDHAVQRITDGAVTRAPVVDVRGAPEEALERLKREEAHRPFDLVDGPLLRTTVLRTGDDEHVVLFTIHHVVSDGWSVGVLVRELTTLYEAYTDGRPSELDELPIQYADFAVWQRRWHEGPAFKQDLDYWTKQLTRGPPAVDIPSDRPRPEVESLRAASRTFTLPAELAQAVREASRREQVTLFMTLLTAMKTLLARYTEQDTVVVGTDIANRHHPNVEELIGFFVNILVLRTDLSGDPSFSEALERVRTVSQEAYAHQDMPFDKLVEELQPERHRWRAPFFQVLFVMQNAPTRPLELSGLTIGAPEVRDDRARFDLAIFVTDEGDEVSLHWVYKTDLYEDGTIERMSDQFEAVLANATQAPDTPLSAIELETAAAAAAREAREKERLESMARGPTRRRRSKVDLSDLDTGPVSPDRPAGSGASDD